MRGAIAHRVENVSGAAITGGGACAAACPKSARNPATFVGPREHAQVLSLSLLSLFTQCVCPRNAEKRQGRSGSKPSVPRARAGGWMGAATAPAATNSPSTRRPKCARPGAASRWCLLPNERT
jgi:hypothetical protein